MTLKALQAKWRAIEESRQDSGQAHVRGWAEGHSHCADALTPHILQQERDRELIRELADSIHFANWTKARSALYAKACERLKEME